MEKETDDVGSKEVNTSREAAPATLVSEGLEAMCEEYRKYLEISSVLERKMPSFQMNIEMLFTRIEEFQTFMTTIAYESERYSQQFPLVTKKMEELKEAFMFIDALDELVARIHADLSNIEKNVSALEQRARTKTAAKTSFSRFMKSLKSSKPVDIPDNIIIRTSTDQFDSSLKRKVK